MSSAYRDARRVVRALRSAGPAPVSRLFAELTDAQRQSTHWIGQAENGSSPCLVADFASHKKNSDALFSDAAVIASVLPEMPTEQLTVDDVGNLLTRLALTTQPRNKFQSLRRLKRDLTLLEWRGWLARPEKKKFAPPPGPRCSRIPRSPPPPTP